MSLTKYKAHTRSSDTVYLVLPDGFDPHVFPLLTFAMEKVPANSLQLNNGCQVIVDDREPQPSELLSPFDALIELDDQAIIDGKDCASVLATFWALQRVSIQDYYKPGGKERGHAAMKRMLAWTVVPGFIDLVMGQYQSVKTNLCYYRQTPVSSKVTANPLDELRHGHQFKLPRAFVINLPERADRRERIEARLARHSIPFTMVKAVSKDSELIDHLSWGADTLNSYQGNMSHYNRRAEFACYVSHVKAIRAFIDSGEAIGLIMEDDAVFRKTFDSLYPILLAKLPTNLSTLSLLVSDQSFYAEWNRPHSWAKTEPSVIPLHGQAWGTVGYLITRAYALQVIDELDRPIRKCPTVGFTRVTSESIMWNSKGYASSIPLLLEEMGVSSINEANAETHRRLFQPFGLENFELE